MSLSKIGDILAPSLSLGIALGRLGCLLNGCCFGKECNSVFSIKWLHFKPHTSAHIFHTLQNRGDYEIVLTQALSSVSALFLFIGLTLLYYKKRNRFRNLLLPIAFLYYSISRFVIEFFRADNPKIFIGLSLSQNISIFVFLLSSLSIYLIYKKRKKLTHEKI